MWNNPKKKDKKEKTKTRPSANQYTENQTKGFEQSNGLEKISQELTEIPKEPPRQIIEKTVPIPKRTKSEIPTIPDKKKLLIDNNTIQLLIDSIDQKFSSCCVDADFPIVIDTIINAAADLTLTKCEDAQKSLNKVIQTTADVVLMSNNLEEKAKETHTQAKLTLSDMKSLKDEINDVLNPKASFFDGIVTFILFILTSLFNLFQIGVGKFDDESFFNDEKLQSDN